MKTAVFIVCLIGITCALPVSNSDSSHHDSSESHSRSLSDSQPDSSSSEEKFRTAPTVNGATVISIITEEFARGDSFRRRRALDTNSIESPSTSKSDSHSDSSSEEVSIVPTPDGATPLQTRGDSLRRRRAIDQVAHSKESVTTESTSRQSQPSESSEEDSHEHSTKKNLLLGILGATTADPDTSEESSEERTTPVFQP